MFDPFGDFDSKGYLRNNFGKKDTREVKESEYMSFSYNLPKAMEFLKNCKTVNYDSVLETHRILFSDMYPWAGKDRLETAPDIAVTKGDVVFAGAREIRRAVDYASKLAQEPPSGMARRPGEIIGTLAYAHPFLEGNGRTILTVTGELAHRAGIQIEWNRTDKAEYLDALTHEVVRPGHGVLDKYLAPFVQPTLSETKRGDLASLESLKPEHGLSTDEGLTGSTLSRGREPEGGREI